MNLIELQPEDVLVLRCPGRMSQAQRDAVLAGFRDFLGPDRKVIFLDAGEALDVIRIAVSGKVETNDIVREDDARLEREYDRIQRRAAQREVQHVDTPDEEPAGIPPHVWLYRNMLTDLQALAPLGRDETNGQYAVAIDQLTEEQRAIPHVRTQLQLRADGHGAEARSKVEVKALAKEPHYEAPLSRKDMLSDYNT